MCAPDAQGSGARATDVAIALSKHATLSATRRSFSQRLFDDRQHDALRIARSELPRSFPRRLGLTELDPRLDAQGFSLLSQLAVGKLALVLVQP